MRKFLLATVFLTILGVGSNTFAQNISMRVIQSNFSSLDPDGVGPATGSVELEFQLMASVPGILADGIPFSAVYQSGLLMATPTNTTTPIGPLALGVGWIQNIDSRVGTDVAVNYGSTNFDKRMIISFVQSSGIPNVPIGTTWEGFARVTYWTKGITYPEGGYATVEPATIVAQNELSSDGGLTTYPYLSPSLDTPIPLGLSILPVTFTDYFINCTDKGTLVSWKTGSEMNSSHFEIQKNSNGSWSTIGNVAAAGNSSTSRSYTFVDMLGGTAQYRIKQVDQDGRYEYTEVRQTNCQSRNVKAFIFPVPARDVLNVRIQSDYSLTTELQVYDMSGKVVKRQPANLSSGTNMVTLNIGNLGSGEYIIRSSNPAMQLNQKFSVIR